MRSHGLKISVAKPSQFVGEPSETCPTTVGTFNPPISYLFFWGVKPKNSPPFHLQAKPCKTMSDHDWLVVWNTAFIFPQYIYIYIYIWDVILPIDFHSYFSICFFNHQADDNCSMIQWNMIISFPDIHGV
jgi:hypothetical protein